ncbi:MAG: 3-hydroxyacyl-CoA dehydrogenase [Planctomycetaceae bacterium]|nr:3-hydroxyacyl-CoA dehydrogenase [Planctomycetaceae bacterium]
MDRQVIAVIGLGTMGHGIVQRFAMAGHHVRCYDESEELCESLVDRVRSNLSPMVEMGLVLKDAVASTLEAIQLCDSLPETMADVYWATEAINECLDAKRDVFQQMESAARPDAILASNSSSFPVSQSAAHLNHPERAVLAHWFNPPQIIPVVEVVPGSRTSPVTVERTMELLKQIGQQPVHIRSELPGFLVNRVQIAMYREIWDLVDRGVVTAEEMDTAIRGSMGMRLAALGPLAINDFAGLDITSTVYRNLVPDLRSDQQLPDLISSLVERGCYGAKTKQGIFSYTSETLHARQVERDQRYLELLRLMAREDSHPKEP